MKILGLRLYTSTSLGSLVDRDTGCVWVRDSKGPVCVFQAIDALVFSVSEFTEKFACFQQGRGYDFKPPLDVELPAWVEVPAWVDSIEVEGEHESRGLRRPLLREASSEPWKVEIPVGGDSCC